LKICHCSSVFLKYNLRFSNLFKNEKFVVLARYFFKADLYSCENIGARFARAFFKFQKIRRFSSVFLKADIYKLENMALASLRLLIPKNLPF
jgi:hypothetical protein